MIATAVSAPLWAVVVVPLLGLVGTGTAAYFGYKATRISANVTERANVVEGYDDFTHRLQDDATSLRAQMDSMSAEVRAATEEARTAREDLARTQLVFRYVWGRLGWPEGYDPIADTERLFSRVLVAVVEYGDDR